MLYTCTVPDIYNEDMRNGDMVDPGWMQGFGQPLLLQCLRMRHKEGAQLSFERRGYKGNRLQSASLFSSNCQENSFPRDRTQFLLRVLCHFRAPPLYQTIVLQDWFQSSGWLTPHHRGYWRLLKAGMTTPPPPTPPHPNISWAQWGTFYLKLKGCRGLLKKLMEVVLPQKLFF